ncbi:hypothetical protein VTK73DRAFT_7362 [Phialemonium thermophilum]|uniref:Uncharacterized protein n=1 Tax=Phialemonium thermophilum TaxID=223376 RepID=A0ABR3WEV1_9PEZI
MKRQAHPSALPLSGCSHQREESGPLAACLVGTENARLHTAPTIPCVRLDVDRVSPGALGRSRWTQLSFFPPLRADPESCLPLATGTYPKYLVDSAPLCLTRSLSRAWQERRCKVGQIGNGEAREYPAFPSREHRSFEAFLSSPPPPKSQSPIPNE